MRGHGAVNRHGQSLAISRHMGAAVEVAAPARGAYPAFRRGRRKNARGHGREHEPEAAQNHGKLFGGVRRFQNLKGGRFRVDQHVDEQARGGRTAMHAQRFASERVSRGAVQAIRTPASGRRSHLLKIAFRRDAVERDEHGQRQAQIEQNAAVDVGGPEPGRKFAPEQFGKRCDAVSAVDQRCPCRRQLFGRNIDAVLQGTGIGVDGDIAKLFGRYGQAGVHAMAQREKNGFAHGAADVGRNGERQALVLDVAASPVFGAALEQRQLRSGKVVDHGAFSLSQRGLPDAGQAEVPSFPVAESDIMQM